MFSTFTGGGGLYARTRDQFSGEINTLIPGSWLGANHRFRVDWGATSVVFSIDGTPVATHNVTVNAGLRPLLSDFNTGGGALVVRWVRMSPYPAAGTFDFARVRRRRERRLGAGHLDERHPGRHEPRGERPHRQHADPRRLVDALPRARRLRAPTSPGARATSSIGRISRPAIPP